MTKLLTLAALSISLIGPAFAGPLEDGGQESLANRAHDLPANAMQVTREILNSGGADINMPPEDADIATRGTTGYTEGHINLAAQLGVSPSEYSLAELARKMIEDHD